MRTWATGRLRGAPLTAGDARALAPLHADPAVMALLGGPSDEAGTATFIAGAQRHWAAHGFGFWAVREALGGRFVGAVGLLVPRFEAHFTPCVELAWRFARAAWGCGYATEAARALLRIGFEELDRAELVAFTVPANARSRAVMSRLGMTHDPADDFDHPLLDAGDPLRRHELHRLQRVDWHRATADAAAVR